MSISNCFTLLSDIYLSRKSHVFVLMFLFIVMYGTFNDESVYVKVFVSCIFISILPPYLFIFLPGYMYVP
jgi:hypothetical protein